MKKATEKEALLMINNVLMKDIALIRSVLGTLILWIGQSSDGVLSMDNAKELLKKLDSNQTKP